MRNRQAKYGINVIEGKVADVSKQNIFGPLAVKEQVINSATEAGSADPQRLMTLLQPRSQE